MAVPPLPRLTLFLERTTGDESVASWELPNDFSVDSRPGMVSIAQAVNWVNDYQPQEGPGGMANTDQTALFWGADNVTATTVTRYLAMGWLQGSASPNLLQYRSPVSGTIRNLRVHHGNPGGNGEAIVYTLRVNGVPSAVAVAIASTAADGADLVDSVAVAAGDLIDIEVTKALGIGSSPTEITASALLDAA